MTNAAAGDGRPETSLASVDAIVPTFNNRPELEACLASLGTQSGARVRVLVAVDGSTDGTLDYLESTEFPMPVKVFLHPGGANRGRAATRNLAMTGIESEFALFLDSDMELSPDALARHVALVRERACISVGSVRYRNRGTALWAAYLSARGRNRWGDGATIPFTQFTTANALLRTIDLQAIGGFDERFAAYGGEDIEFAYRLQQATGRSFVHNLAASATTVETKSIDEALTQFRAYGATNLRLMHALHPEMPATFHVDRLTSRSLRARLFVAVMNPLTDRLASLVVRFAPFALKRQLINYQVVRAVLTGYRSAGPP